MNTEALASFMRSLRGLAPNRTIVRHILSQKAFDRLATYLRLLTDARKAGDFSGIEIPANASTSEAFDSEAGFLKAGLMHQELSGIIRAFDL